MPSYSNLMSRGDAAGDVPAEFAEQIIGDVETESTALALGRRVPVGTRDSRVPILSSVPDAFFVTGDSGLKQTSAATFESTPLIAEEIAVIIAIPDAVLADSTVDLWAAISPLVARAFARRLDRAVIFGQEKPATWPAGMVPAAIAAGNTVPRTADPVVDVLAAAGVVAEVEYNPTAAAVATGWQFRAASSRSDAFHGSPIGPDGTLVPMIAGLPVRTNPVYWDATVADVVVADWRNVLLGVRQEMTVSFSESAVITNDAGVVQSNMWQQDSTSMRAVMRVGYHLAQPVTQSGTAGVPVAVVTPGSTAS